LVNKIELVSNDRFVTCSHDFTIKLFDLNTLECIRTFIGHEDTVRGINESSDETIVSCSSDKTIRIWNLNSGECLKNIKRTFKRGNMYKRDI
jgi:WD40 repeat protein